jgi:hypothetical protein
MGRCGHRVKFCRSGTAKEATQFFHFLNEICLQAFKSQCMNIFRFIWLQIVPVAFVEVEPGPIPKCPFAPALSRFQDRDNYFLQSLYPVSGYPFTGRELDGRPKLVS